MTDRRTGWFWPLGARPYIVAGAAVFLVTMAGGWGMLRWPFQEWPQTSALFHQRLDLAGPTAAFLGAYISGRLTPPSRVFALPRFQRDPLHVVAHQAVPLCLVHTTAYLLGLAPVLILTWRTATFGALDVPVAVSGVLALWLFTVVGLLAGLLARSAFIAPVMFAAGMVATILGYSGDTYAAVAPVMHISPALGFHASGPIVAYRIAFFVAVIATCVITAVGVFAHRQFQRRPPSPSRALVWIFPAAFALVGVAKTPALFVGDDSLPRNCRTVTGVEYCVHAGHAAQLEPLINAVNPIIAPFGADNLPFDRVYDRALAGPTTLHEDTHTYYYDISPTLSIDSNTSDITRIAAGAPACTTAYDLNAQNEFTRNMTLLSERLSGENSRHSDNPFTKLTDSQLRDWVTAHRPPVRSCAISNAMLP